MFFNPYYPYYYHFINREEKSYVRVLHASPDAPSVDVYANGNLIARNLAYRGFTEYLPVDPGRYRIRVFPAGQTINPVIDTNVNIPPRSIFTVAAVGTLPEISLLPVQDPVIPIPPGMVYLRFAHLSPDAPNVDVTLPDGTILFANTGFRQVTGYIPVYPGTYAIQVRPAGTEDVVLYVPNITLRPDRFYTVYAVGFVRATPSLQVLIPLDGNTYISV